MNISKKLIGTLLLSMTLLVGCGSNTAKNEENNSKEETNTKIENADYKIGIIKYMDQISLDEAREGFIDEMEKNNIEVEYIDKSENGDVSLTTTVPQKMVSEDVDLIYAIATPAAQGAKNVVKDIPIVFSAVTDPVGAGLVESIESPGANVSGISDYIDPQGQIETFLKLYPDTKTFGVLYNTSEQNSLVQVEELEKKLNKMDIKLEKIGVPNVNDIPQAITSLSKKCDALFALTDNMVANAAPVVSETLLKNNLPSLSAEEGQVKNGLLMSEGVNYYEHGAQAARLAIKILKGEDVKNLPVEYNEKNIKKVNEKTAKALNVDLGDEILKDAEIIK
ncbi:ABC transporter substrate-binding protein [Peptoniphilus stercorisuis]|uniref:ABC transport system substrate-binding protein n=1 Tax=Peptoniphilus stercorisuis TaxID=1436965 RepID=A0ABS4KAC6_9FIRM|nr:ABC transporter substrate-binding protein [Peptoniphilus stercorisuis]MBP2024707.1 putative ABC transport system substrate-binding protein [Peptoniphilus stercorisuis]